MKVTVPMMTKKYLDYSIIMANMNEVSDKDKDNKHHDSDQD